ncbi:MAG: DUF4430 domain-containing protein [Planctomycetaceae bacterium]|nr:MAG: DUF4430 domain-containing protein [Planctomycetaceae bacterium]
MFRPTCHARCGRLLIGAALILVAVPLAVSANAAEPPARTIALTIDYGDGVQKHFPRLAWKESMTVLDAMQAAQDHPRGIAFRYRGRGATAFLVQIDDLENQGRDRNWLYRINGKLADRSFAVQTVQPKDQITWEFGQPYSGK